MSDSAFKPHGMHLIAGKWVANETRFQSTPVHGDGHSFSEGTAENVDDACIQAEAAFEAYAATTTQERADFLNAIADEIEARGAEITEIGCAETGLPQARLQGERGRTTGQLKLFAQHILQGDYLDQRHDPALPERAPLPRPDLKMVQRPIGPVGVFGASNFPLAFSTAGGDTASALAAGCPVVVKGHPAHPGTGEIIAEAIHAAIVKTGMPAGVFSLIQGSGIEVGTELVQHPLIQAIGFTGSLGAGRALFDLCAARSVPIPFCGELGSINPVFVLEGALAARSAEIGAGWAGSLVMGAGQFCTNPGLVVVPDGPDADVFIQSAKAALEGVAPQDMLTNGIAAAYQSGQKKMSSVSGVSNLLSNTCGDRQAMPNLLETTGDVWQANASLREEVFGPLGIVVRVKDAEEAAQIARGLDGQLTTTLQMESSDMEQARGLVSILERKAGRILANGFPTGVEVADAMVHGGPYPASTNFGASSVGTIAIRRFLRPVCYQDLPTELLPV